MTTGDATILPTHGRAGPWFTANNDQDADVQNPVPRMVCNPVASNFVCFPWALNTTGAVVGVNAYAAIGFDLNQIAGMTMPYNASMYTGIVFWAKTTAGSQSLHVQFPIPGTVASGSGSGGTCSSMCGDNYEKKVPLTSTWAPYTVPFASLHQQSFGTAVPFTANAILTIQFQVTVDTTTAFNFWIGAVGFY
jgi:hypothetical protein